MPQQSDTEMLRDSMTREVSNDAYAIASQIFKGPEPDVGRVSNQQLDERYRQAFVSNDRQYLQQEATRDPAQFLASMQRLGVTMPPGQELQPEPPLPKAAKANVPVPKTPPQAQQPTFSTAEEVPAQPLAAPAAVPAPPLQAAAPPVMPPPGVIPAMASGGVVTQPTVALIGEQGPEAVVPLTSPPQTDVSGPGYPGTAPAGNAPFDPARPQPGDIQNYIDQAARARGIDPEVAMSVAYFEGGRDPNNPNQPPFTDPAVRGTFKTGSSWWPFQLHYGGPGYQQYGTTAGMGNDFTRATGYQPGDPAAWRASVDFALDKALQLGWYPGWYGSKPAGVSQWQGIPGH